MSGNGIQHRNLQCSTRCFHRFKKCFAIYSVSPISFSPLSLHQVIQASLLRVISFILFFTYLTSLYSLSLSLFLDRSSGPLLIHTLSLSLSHFKTFPSNSFFYFSFSHSLSYSCLSLSVTHSYLLCLSLSQTNSFLARES